jgi:hypothetical protein
MLVDSKHEELSNEEIIRIAAEETISQYSPEQVLAAVMAEAHQPDTLVIRQGNTLFILHRAPEKKHIGVFRALNADTPANYLENSIMFIKACKSMGFKTVVSQFEDPSILNIFKYISRNPPFAGMGYQVQRTSDGGFQASVNLGSDKQGGLEVAQKKVAR